MSLFLGYRISSNKKYNRFADPVFALFIGTSSAFLRIQRDMRDEIAAADSQTQSQQGLPPHGQQTQPEVKFSEIWQIGARRVGMWWRGEFAGL